ncbi:YIP1 family protein [Streptomyces sp. TRM70308]|uniref:Yip1 family protein n=1 Tax=Streptomyces sp. TRM70308 TaxID=3131932 RepID=UPI003D093256
MAGFRIGRGRHPQNAQQGQQGQYPPASPGSPGPGAVPGAGPGQPPYGRPVQSPYGQDPYGRPQHGGPGQAPYGQPGVTWGQGGAPGAPAPDGRDHGHGYGHGEPEYLGGPAADPYADAPGHTRQFTFGDPDGVPPGHPGEGDDYGSGSTYAAGRQGGPPAGPRLPWKQLLSGLVLRPNATFWQMRDHTVWGPAVTVTFLYGLLAVFGLAEPREEVLSSTLSTAVPFVLMTGVAVVLSALVLGSVTHALARQFGGTGAWAPTVGLAMLIASLTDAPRLLFAFFLGGDAPFVQVLGWLTWVAAGALFTAMVSRSHDLPWPRALGASGIQLLALLFLIKLGTL